MIELPKVADERDVLLAGTLSERRLYRQFTDRQVITPASFRRLDGRRVRRAYLTELFHSVRDADKVLETVKRSMLRTPSELADDDRIKPVALWERDAWLDYVLMKRAELGLIEREFVKRFGEV